MLPTPAQLRLLDFIRSYIAEHGYAPTTEEMRQAVGVSSKGNVVRLLKCLEDRGQIRRKHHRARGVVPIEGDDPYSSETLARLSSGELGAIIYRARTILAARKQVAA